ncbi:coiled-coil domain-containing protein 63 [Hydra vulgaris]|uniref:coiled-coil domain-containing protein 63 n=1 Tax=Hydra vulgaris TaxID=6087 RepID=UPI0001925CD8|nr:coiled-coil domain-containing protein 63-like [Hydra vulgaris]
MSEENVKEQTDHFTDDTQSELLRLQRQYRILENERQAYKENSENDLRKLNKTLSKLRKENDELKIEYKIAFSTKNKSNEFQITEELKNLLLAENCAKHDLLQVTKKLELVNKDIKNYHMKIDLFRKHLKGLKESKAKDENIQNLNRIIENRLNVAHFKLNNALTINKRKKQEITHLKIQRDRFFDLRKKLQEIYNNGRTRKSFLIENAKAHFSSRDEAQHRLQFLRDRSDRDIIAYNTELKDILRIIDHENKLRLFIDTKMEEHAESYDIILKERIEKKLNSNIRVLNIEVENYESVFNQLFKVESTDNIDEMINSFKIEEKELFALYNFVKEQSKEIEINENLIETINKQSISFKDIQLANENKMNNSLEKLQGKKKNLNDEIINTSSMTSANQQKLINLLPVIEKVLIKVQPIHSKSTVKLGCSKITQNNLLLYLGQLEQITTEILRTKTMLSRKSPLSEPQKSSLLVVGKDLLYSVNLPSVSLDVSDYSTPTSIHENALKSFHENTIT